MNISAEMEGVHVIYTIMNSILIYYIQMYYTYILICFSYVHSFFSRLLEVDPVIIRLERMTVVTFSSPSGESGSQANLGERMGREKKGREDERNV